MLRPFPHWEERNWLFVQGLCAFPVAKISPQENFKSSELLLAQTKEVKVLKLPGYRQITLKSQLCTGKVGYRKCFKRQNITT